MLTTKKFSSNIKKINRKLWTLSSGNAVGYIEGISRDGYFIKNNSLLIRQTSSGTAHGQMFDLAYSNEYAALNNDKLIKLMTYRKRVKVTFKSDFFGLPSAGHILGPHYLIDIEEINPQ